MHVYYLRSIFSKFRRLSSGSDLGRASDANPPNGLLDVRSHSASGMSGLISAGIQSFLRHDPWAPATRAAPVESQDCWKPLPRGYIEHLELTIRLWCLHDLVLHTDPHDSVHCKCPGPFHFRLIRITPCVPVVWHRPVLLRGAHRCRCAKAYFGARAAGTNLDGQSDRGGRQASRL